MLYQEGQEQNLIGPYELRVLKGRDLHIKRINFKVKTLPGSIQAPDVHD